MTPTINDVKTTTSIVVFTFGDNEFYVEIIENDTKFCYGKDISKQDWIDFIAHCKTGGTKILTSVQNMALGELDKKYEKTTITCHNYFLHYPNRSISEQITDDYDSNTDFIKAFKKLF